MRRTMRVFLVACLALTIAGFGFVRVPTAYACSLVVPFTVTSEHLVGDFNAPDSLMQRDYRQWEGDDEALIELRGVYVYESIYYVAGDGDWGSGSLSVPMLIWGEWPEDTSPEVIKPERYNADACPPQSGGYAVGQRRYSAVANGFVAFEVNDETEAALTAAFGAPDTVPRDEDLERDLIAQINATRRSTTRLFIGGGLAAIALAGVVMYMSRGERGTPSDPAPEDS